MKMIHKIKKYTKKPAGTAREKQKGEKEKK